MSLLSLRQTSLAAVGLTFLLTAPLAAQTTHTVTQIGLDFSPANLVIDAGDTVEWVWNDMDHTVTEGPGPFPVGGEAFNEPFSALNPLVRITFDETFLAANPRTDNFYDYYCIPHFGFGMVGTITVREVYGYYIEGAQEVPPNGSAGAGRGTMSLNLATNEVSWSFTFENLSGAATGAHFHQAPAGSNGGVQLGLSPVSPNTGSDFVSAAQENAIRAGNWYVNIHTASFPGGEIRGQIIKGSWDNLGGGSSGAVGEPLLLGIGPLTGESVLALDLSNAPPNELMLLWVSLSSSPFNIFGGTLYAFPFLDQVLLGTNSSGQFAAGIALPNDLPPGTEIWFQFIIQDLTTLNGLILSNAVKATSP